MSGDGKIVGQSEDDFSIHPVIAGYAVFFAVVGDFSAKVNLVTDFGTTEFPRVAKTQPVIRTFDLLAIFDVLMEHAVFIANAIATGRVVQGGQGIHETGGQASQSPVAQARILFHGADRLEVHPQIGQTFPAGIEQSKIVEAIDQHPAEEKLEREVIDPFAFVPVKPLLGLNPVFRHAVAHGMGNGHEPIMVRGLVPGLADSKEQMIGNATLERHFVQSGAIVGKGRG